MLGLGEGDGVPSIVVAPGVKEVRPYLVCCVIHNLDFSGDLFKRFITLQVRLHKETYMGHVYCTFCPKHL